MPITPNREIQASSLKYLGCGSYNDIYTTTIDGRDFVIKKMKVRDYDLALMLPDFAKNDFSKAETGKIYLSENPREYYVKGMQNKCSIDDRRINLSNLQERLNDQFLKENILRIASINMHVHTELTDLPLRSVRLWNLINHDLQPKAEVVDVIDKEGRKHTVWACPFVTGRQASDKEMSRALIDVFNSTGRIVLDAMSPKNFVTTAEGKVICIDIGMALNMERRLERKPSMVSLDTLGDAGLMRNYRSYYHDPSIVRNYSLAVATVKSLRFLKEHRPDIYDIEFLKDNGRLLNICAKAYDAEQISEVDQQTLDAKYSEHMYKRSKSEFFKEKIEKVDVSVVDEALDELEKIQELTFLTSKEACIHQINCLSKENPYKDYTSLVESIKDCDDYATLQEIIFDTMDKTDVPVEIRALNECINIILVGFSYDVEAQSKIEKLVDSSPKS